VTCSVPAANAECCFCAILQAMLTTPPPDPAAQAHATSVPAQPGPTVIGAGSAQADRAALQLAMRMGDALLSAGMSANDVVVFMLRVTDAYRLRGVHVDVTYTSISASYYPGPGLAPITSIRVIRPTVVDYTRVRRIDRLSTEIEAGLPLDEATAALERIRSAKHPYPVWISTIGNAGVAPSASLLFTTDWKILVLTFLTGCLVDGVQRASGARRVPPFFQQLLAAGLITAVAAAVAYGGRQGVPSLVGLDPTLIVVGGIVMLVAGMMIVGAVQDAIDQFYVTASARVFEVFMRTAGIVAGIVIALRLAQNLGAPLSISASPIAFGPPWAQFTAVGLIAGFFTLSVYADAVTILLAVGMALVAWLGYTSTVDIGVGEVVGGTVGALLAAVLTTLIVRRTHVPGFGLITAALLPLVPGLTLYQGLLQLVGTGPDNGDPATGGATLLHAGSIAVGIGAGASLGIFLGRPIVDQVRRITHRRRNGH
jgi:uncharacterized membrane protein YjjP (DUF1212 family)